MKESCSEVWTSDIGENMSKILILVMAVVLLLSGCSAKIEMEKETEQNMYIQITASEAKKMMDEQEEILILDVREQSEYNEGHIPGAALLPVGTISEDTAAAVIGNKDTVVLVYCRSGNRSKTAAQALADLGYTQIYEFGGIRDWPYEVEK